MDAAWIAAADPEANKILGEEYHEDMPVTRELFDSLFPKDIGNAKNRSVRRAEE